MRTLSRLLLFVLLLWSLGAEARVLPPSRAVGQPGSGGGGGGSSCATFNAFPTEDGCSSAPAGLMQDTGYFSSYLSSGQSLSAVSTFTQSTAAHPPPFNVACVDYACGQITATASLGDPATATLPSGCTYHAFTTTNPAGGGYGPSAWDSVIGNGYPAMLVCKSTGASPMLITQLNFGSVGGHGCTVLYLDPTSTQDFDIKDNRFEFTAECTTNMRGGGAGGHSVIIGTDATYTVNMTFENNTVIGHAYDACCKYAGTGGQSSAPYDNASIFIFGFKSSGTVLLKYDWFQEIPGQTLLLAGNCAGSGSITVEYSYIRDFQVTTPQGHGEWSNAGCFNSETWSFDTIAGTSSNGADWDAAINLGNSNGSETINTATVDGVVAIINGVNGATTSNLFPNAYGSMTGGVFTVWYTSGTVEPGANGNFANAITNGPLAIHANLSGSGIGSTWSMDCGAGTVAGQIGCPEWAQSWLPSGTLHGQQAFLTTGPPSNAMNLATTVPGFGGSGYGTSVTGGTLTYSGAGCSTNPVLTVNTNSSGAISAITSITNYGVCSSPPSGAISSWTPSGTLSAGSGVIIWGSTPGTALMASAVVQNGGSGYTASTAGTATYNGSGCSVNPVLNIYSNSSGVISTAAVSSLGTCTSPPVSGSTNWTVGGGISGGSSASFYVSGGQVSNEIAANFVDYGHGHFGAVTLKRNYVSPSLLASWNSGTGLGAFGLRGGDITCGAATTWGSSATDNYNMETGAALAHGFNPTINGTAC